MKNGQALVVTLLIMGIALTIGLSVISRSITEINVSTSADESARALEAAEQGVEKSLSGIIAGTGGSDTLAVSNATVQVVNSTVAGSPNTPFNVPFRLAAGEVVSVDLNGYTGSNLSICFGDNSLSPAPVAPALDISLYYQNGSAIGVGRMGIDNLTRNGFLTNSSGGSNCSSAHRFAHYLNLNSLKPAGAGHLLLRIRMLYNTTTTETISIVPQNGTSLPSQGADVVSTGQSGTSTQKIRVAQLKSDLPMMFDAALFSGTNLVQ